MNKEPGKDPDRRSYPPVMGIGRDEHVGVVREIFSTITVRYDFLNRVLSLRRDVAWRRFAVRKMRFFETFRLLDVATGTADLAVETAIRHPPVRIAGLDLVREMLAVGAEKIARRGLSGRISLVQGDALSLPFPGESFDAVSVAFGIRNMPDRPGALREMRRVLVPGGRVFILEMNAPQTRLWKKAFAPYLKRVLPRVARLFSRNPAAYVYLVDSILHFPAPETFIGMMEEAGFGEVERHSLTLGITCLYIGRNGKRVQGSRP